MLRARLKIRAGNRALAALLVAEGEPLTVPDLSDIDARIETSHTAWQHWAQNLKYTGCYPEQVRRSALALKFLWYSPHRCAGRGGNHFAAGGHRRREKL
ncbi:Glucoamylase and related glycosyl hydrolases [Pluralibacter gergoviae]|nr:Glucoamylase and related glycosyl hydrolases [Pluralibacter gergoviae]